MNKKLICVVLSLVMVMAFAVGVHASEEATAVQKLTGKVDGLEISADTLLDLNGYDVTNATVAEGVTLQLMDSANDEYDASKCGSFSGTVNGTVEQVVKYDAKNYLVIEENGVYSAHRFYAGITHISLVPEQAALGYKAEFHADEVINEMVTGYGYAMWLNSYNPVKYIKEGTIEKNVLSLRVKNILRENNDEMNAIGAAAQIGGKAMIRFEVDGVELTLEGADYVTTLKDAVESVNASLGADRTAYTAEKVQAVRGLLEKYSSYTNAWEQEYIFTEDKFAAVENVSVTYGDALTLGQVFTAVEGVEIGNVTATVNGEAIAVDANWADTVLNLSAGEAEITITDNDRCWTATNTVAVAKANPSYEIPTGITAKVGDSLADVALPAGFAWADPSQTVADMGVLTFAAVYDCGDNNYHTVDVSVEVIGKDHMFAEGAVMNSYPEGTTLTLGEIFKVTDYAIDSAKVTAAVNGEALTVDASDWAVTEIHLDSIGFYTVEIYGGEYCLGASVTIGAEAKEDKFIAKTVNDVPYGTSLTLGDLFEGTGINSKVTYTVNGETFSIIPPNSSNWAEKVITFDAVGTYIITIVENAFCNVATNTVTVVKADPEVEMLPSFTGIYGQTLAEFELPEGYAWVDDSLSVGNVGMNYFDVIFTPADPNYNAVKISVGVVVEKADPEYTVPENLTAVYGQSQEEIQLPEGFNWENPSSDVGSVGTNCLYVSYTPADQENYNTIYQIPVYVTVEKADPQVPPIGPLYAYYGDDVSAIELMDHQFTWESTGPVADVGEHTYYLTYTPHDTWNYNTVTGVPVTVVVQPGIPQVPELGTLQAYYGQTLADINLLQGFTWTDPAMSVGDVGTKAFDAVYDLEDPNYMVMPVSVSVQVNPADPTYEIPTGLTATYGQTLADVALPSGFTWKDSGLSVGNAGTNSFTAVYSNGDANYNAVEVTVTVEVAKANPSYTVPTGLTATYGQTLANVTLPSGFAWKDSGASVGNAGTNSFTAVYTPADTANYNSVEVTVSVAVAKANPNYTVPTGLTATVGQTLDDVDLADGWNWKNSDLSVGSAGTNSFTAVFTPDDTANYNTVEVSVSVEVTAAEKVDKFDKALTGDFLYRVGNANTVALGSLFKALDGVEIGTVTATISKVAGDAAGVYTANSTWTAGTIKFAGTGVVQVTISDETSNPFTITLEVVNATNVTQYGELKNQNSVLLNDITMSSGSTYVLSNATLYGNGFTFDVTAGAYAGTGQVSGNYLVFLNGNAHLDNVQIIGKVYTTYGAQAADDYNRPVVLSVGNNTITNCYISNCASPVRIRDGNLEIINTTLKGGNFANLDIRGGNVVLDNVTTINQVNGNDTAADGSVVVGLGVVVYYENVLNTTTVTVKNGITQYNVMSEAQANTYIKDTQAKQLTTKIFTVNDVIFNDGTTKWVNAGILSMIDTVGDANITDVSGYTSASSTLLGSTGYVHTKVPTAADTTASAPAYVSAGQGPIAPSCSFDYETKNYVAKTDGSNDFCYYDNGTVMISMDDGDTFNWDTSILTAKKLGTPLDYTVTMNGTDYTGKVIAFNQTGKYEVVYTYTDGNNYKLDASGEITTYEKTYTKTVHINVAVVMPDAKHAEFTFGSSNTASKQVTVGQNTYVMPNVSATSSTIGSTDVSGTTVYYPIVEIVMSDKKTSHTSAWYAYFPVFSGAVTITDYAESGTGSAITYGSSTTTMPSGLSLVGDASTLFKYQSSSSAGASPVVKNNILVYSSPSISAKRSEYNTVVQYKYQDNAGLTYYYYIGYHAPAQSYSSCFASDTLINMADGTQKEVQYVSAEELIQVWDFYTGEYTVVPAGYVMDHGYGENVEIKLEFADGTTVKVVNEHGFFDVASNEFVFINESNVDDYLGHSFAKQSGEGFESVELISYTVTTGYMESWSILSYGHYNCLAEGMLALTAHEAEGNFFMPFEVGADMKFDEAKMLVDIETYGVYTYEEFADVMSKELFDALNMPYVKVAVGKGITSEEDIWYLLNLHFGIERP